jgi:glycyl-tRNA synthetase
MTPEEMGEDMSEALDFQSIIMKLESFWADQGCLIWQPYHTEVGAGTMNPATSLRVLGPEPWNVGYVEPSIRPDDGRYGENPNRFYQHTQYQVILKPDPGNPQELYLASLEALGIDPVLDDIRFVEDNWKSPIIGAWGLGWEVWLNGLEITQFTYFQQAGGQTLDPVSVELTYGLERIAMALQKVRDFRNIRWTEDLTYGDVQLQSEQQFSKYAFELANVDHLREMYQLFEEEAETCLAEKQVLPAHDYVLKCSHTFNLLDTRGAVGVTERQSFFGRMRDLSRRVAEAYLEERMALEYPWLKEGDEEFEPGEQDGAKRAGRGKHLSEPADFLLEIGTEELPAGDVEDALAQLETAVPELIQELRLTLDGHRVLATPRRLVVVLENLAPRQQDLEQQVKGPPADRAFDEDGNPTRAAEGFARSKGLEVSDLEVVEIDGGRYVAAVEKEAGRPSGEVLAEALPDLIADLGFRQSMRWNASNVGFSRPIRWLTAFHGERFLPFSYADIQAQPTTRGLRFLEPESLPLTGPDEYFRVLAEQGIVLDQDRRRKVILDQVTALADEVDGKIPRDPDLLTEVTHLVEAPTALRGAFDEKYLDLPREVLISVMKKHQRYFPVGGEENLLPYFITVANKPRAENAHELYRSVIQGNADVILARFADAEFFVRADLQRELEDYLPDLELLTFQADLGSMRDKSRRIARLVDPIAEALGLDEEQLAASRRAAELCKADLATKMVVEMTSLQGVMGYYYALESGEDPAVAVAIREHYAPASAGEPGPESKPGLAVGLADKLDSLVGLFAAGLAPTGSKDPFAQRRAALGLVSSLIEWNEDLDLERMVVAAAGELPIPADQATRKECLEFIRGRLENYLRDEGFAYDVVAAVVAEQGHNPAGAARGAEDLSKWVEREDWEDILDNYARCVRITRDLEEVYPVDPARLEAPEEKALHQAVGKAELAGREPGDVDAFLQAFQPLIPAVEDFFDQVLVMVEDQALRENRLGLLQKVAGLSAGCADLSELEGF